MAELTIKEIERQKELKRRKIKKIIKKILLGFFCVIIIALMFLSVFELWIVK